MEKIGTIEYKRLIIFILSFIVSIILFQTSVFAEERIRVFFDENEFILKQQPVIVEGRTFLPYREISELLDFELLWDSSEKKVTALKDGKKIDLWIGKKTANINGMIIENDVEPFIINGRTMIPLRFISESFNYKVSWDAKSKTITLNEMIIPLKDENPLIQVSRGGFRKIFDSTKVKDRNYNKISTKVRLGKVTGIDEKLIGMNYHEASYIYFGVKDPDGKSDLEIGFTKTDDNQDAWRIIVNYKAANEEDRDNTIEKINEMGGAFSKIGNTGIWADFKELKVYDESLIEISMEEIEGNIIFSVLNISDKNKEVIRFNIPFSKATNNGGYLIFRMVGSYLVNTYDSLYDGKMTADVENIKVYAGNEESLWDGKWEWVEDEGKEKPYNARIFSKPGGGILIVFGNI